MNFLLFLIKYLPVSKITKIIENYLKIENFKPIPF